MSSRRQSIVLLPIPCDSSSDNEITTTTATTVCIIDESDVEIIESDNDQYESIAPTLEIPENILPLKEPAKVATEFSKFFEERSGRRPLSYVPSPNVMESLQRPTAVSTNTSSMAYFPDSSALNNFDTLTRPGSPGSHRTAVSVAISPEDDLKSKMELLELNVPGKLTIESTASVPFLMTTSTPSQGFDSNPINEPPKSWVAPESWAVIAPLITTESSDQVSVSANVPATPSTMISNGSDSNGNELSAIRIYKIDGKHHRTASIVNMLDNFFQPSVLLACPLNTTALEICTTLTQKYFTSYDSSRYRLYVTHGGIERMLSKDEQPLLLQLYWLKEIGYTEEDELMKLGRDDHSYLFRFVFREVPVKNKVLNELNYNNNSNNNSNNNNESEDSSCKQQHQLPHRNKSKITQRTAHLADENLSVIPVALYKNAPSLESLDLSKNTLLDLPEDFFEMLRNLRILVLKGNYLFSLPPALLHLKSSLTHLNLSQNNLSSGMGVELLSQLGNLTNLDLSCNRIDTLPDNFKNLKNLQFLNLSTNSLKAFPSILFNFKLLKDLNLSFNLIPSIPDDIAEIQSLRTLNLIGNSLISISPKISLLKHLRLLDLKQNCISLLPAVIGIPSLTELNVPHNSILNFIESDSTTNSISSGTETAEHTRSRGSASASDGISNCNSNTGSRSSIITVVNNSNTNTNTNTTNTNTNTNTNNWRYMAILNFENNGLTSLKFSNILLNVKFINLNCCKLVELPTNFFHFIPNIHTILLDRNQLHLLPESINSAVWLENVSIGSNLLTDLSGVKFSKLLNLKTFNLLGNNLKFIPSDIWNSPALSSLNLSSNFLSEFPSPPMSFEDLPLTLTLKELYLADNRLKTESLYNLSSLTRLTILNLSCNEIVDLEENLNSLHRLVEFYVSDNEITRLPDEIDKWTNLKILHLNGNRFMSLSFDLCRNSQLEVLDCSGNNLKYNISNYPYDWNWAWNTELKYLNLSDNRRLEIKSNHNSNHNNNNNNNKMINNNNNLFNGEKSLTDFKNLVKLKFLNVARVNISDDCVPIESTSLRVRRDWDALDNPKIGISQWAGRSGTFDTFDVIQKRFLNQANHHVAAIFSGRGESLVSLHLYDTFLVDLETEINRVGGPEMLTSEPASPYLTLNSDSAEMSPGSVTKIDFAAVLRRAFLNCNRRLSSQPTPIRAGSTATLVYLLNDTAWVANVGDTMAILSREGQAINLSVRHHSWSRGEIDRIRSLGGYVSSNGLLSSELDITRAFGYFQLLPYLNANPSISQTPLSERDEFIVVASYELWIFISYQMAVDLVRQYPTDPTLGAYKLRDLAISYGASKSITVLVIDLRQLNENKSSSTSTSNITTPTITPKSYKDNHAVTDQGLSRLEKEIDPPTGEVTLVFTDIKDSTTLWELYPAPMRVALRMHDSIMRRSLRRIGGYEVKNDGDSFMASFPSVHTALKWACTVQKELLDADWPQEIIDSPIAPTIAHPSDPKIPMLRGLSVRIGMHTGQPFCEIHSVTDRMDYTGPMVNFTARVGSAPTGGQIFVTPQVIQRYSKFTHNVKEDIGNLIIFDMGFMKFKGVEKAERLFAVYPENLAKRHEILQGTKSDPFLIEEDNKI